MLIQHAHTQGLLETRRCLIPCISAQNRHPLRPGAPHPCSRLRRDYSLPKRSLEGAWCFCHASARQDSARGGVGVLLSPKLVPLLEAQLVVISERTMQLKLRALSFSELSFAEMRTRYSFLNNSLLEKWTGPTASGTTARCGTVSQKDPTRERLAKLTRSYRFYLYTCEILAIDI